jgi:hypothetical protein
MGERSAGVYIEVDGEEGNLLRTGAEHSITARIATQPGRYFVVTVADTGVWTISEALLDGPPRLVARGQLPSSRYDEHDHRIGH